MVARGERAEVEQRRDLAVRVSRGHESRDRERYTRQMAHFHLKNARSWGDERTGTDLAAQIDPGFVLGENVTASA